MFVMSDGKHFRAVAEPSDSSMVRLLAADREYLSELVFPESSVAALEDSGEFSAVVSRGIFGQILFALAVNDASYPATGSAGADREEALAVAAITVDIDSAWRSVDDAT